MERALLGIVAVGLAVGFVVLARLAWQAGQARAQQRAAFFDDCATLLTEPRSGTGSAGFPRLGGRWRGRTVDLQAVSDTLTFRKLPALWVLLTLPDPLPVRATLNLMIRPTGIEPFSRFHLLPDQISPPPGFPVDCAIRTDDPDGLLPDIVLRPHLTLFDDELVKELVISPNGLRISFLAEEANRGRYLIFRDAEVGQVPLAADRIAPLLGRLTALRADIVAATSRDTA